MPIKRYAVYFLLFTVVFLLLIPVRESSANNESPSLSVGNIACTHGMAALEGWDNRMEAIRIQFISELVGQYQCHVQTRWQGLEAMTERVINDIAYIDSLKVPADGVQTADFMISGFISAAMNGGGITGKLFFVDIKQDDKREIPNTGFESPGIFVVGEHMARTTAHQLSLRPRNGTGSPISKDLVVVVCPFLRIGGQGSKENNDLAIGVEMALQESGGFKRLVDRKNINDVLKEHNLAALNSSNSTVNARLLASLVKADILVMGQIAPWPKGLRLDAYLVDGKSGAVLASKPAVIPGNADLLKETIKCVLDLVNLPVSMPAFSTSSPNIRRREAQLLMSQDLLPKGEIVSDGVGTINAQTLFWSSFVNGIEGAYILVHDDPDFVYQTILSLCKQTRHMDRSWGEVGISGYPSTQRAAVLVNTALEPFTHSTATPDPLLLRAEALMIAARYKEALALVEQHIKTCPEENLKKAMIVKARCMQKLGSLDEALELLKQAGGVEKQQASELEYLAKRAKNEIETQRLEKKLHDSRANGAASEYATIKNLIEKAAKPISVDQLDRYLRLMLEVEGPQKAYEVKGVPEVCFNGPYAATGWNQLRLCLHRAACELALGKKEDAARSCLRVIESVSLPHTFRYDPEEKMMAEAQRMLSKIEQETGPVKDTWMFGQDIRPLQGKYGFYIIPVGDVDDEIMRCIVSNLRQFFGDIIHVLPKVEVPETLKPASGSMEYDQVELLRHTMKTVAIPDNAFMVTCIAKLPLRSNWTFGFKLLNSRDNVCMPNPALTTCSSYEFIGHSNWKAVMGQMKAWRFIHILRETYRGAWKTGHCSYDTACGVYPCVFSIDLYDQGGSLLPRKMCPACQEEYRKVDFDKIHNDLMDFLKKAGAKIVKAEIR